MSGGESAPAASEARKRKLGAKRASGQEHDRRVELLSPWQRAVMRSALERLVPVFHDDAIGEAFNTAQRALATTWRRLGP